jgi:hypothetical protein
MPSKITLALFACVAYRAASVMAVPMQNSYDLTERDYADFAELEARMFDNDFEDFIARQTGAPPVTEAPPVDAAVAEPNGPTGGNTLASTGAPGGEAHHHHSHHELEGSHRGHRHGGHGQGGHHGHGDRAGQRRRRRQRQRMLRHHSGAGAKEAAPDASAPVAQQDPNPPAPALSAREPPTALAAEAAPKHDALVEGATPADGGSKALKTGDLAEGAPKADTLAEGAPKKASKGLGHRRHHRHRTIAELKADPTLSASQRRRLILKAKRRQALRAKRLAALSEGQTEPHQRTRHQLDTATADAVVPENRTKGAAALANGPGAPPASSL